MCVGVVRGCLCAGMSNHLLMCSSWPVPKYRLVLALLVVVVVTELVVGWWVWLGGLDAFAACVLLSLSGSCLC